VLARNPGITCRQLGQDILRQCRRQATVGALIRAQDQIAWLGGDRARADQAESVALAGQIDALQADLGALDRTISETFPDFRDLTLPNLCRWPKCKRC
jgi:hypothetical protein